MAHAGGRPPLFKDPEEMQEKINEYIDECEENKVPYTITGLCYYLGFTSRQSFYDYEKNSKFSYTVKRARLFIENSYELSLRINGRSGDIFALKNFGWTDKSEIEHSGKTTHVNVDYNSLTDEEAKKLYMEQIKNINKK
jgi:hypothetical protein